MAEQSTPLSTAMLIVGGVASWLILVFLNEVYKEFLREVGAPARLVGFVLMKNRPVSSKQGEPGKDTIIPFRLRGDLDQIPSDRRDLRSMSIFTILMSAFISTILFIDGNNRPAGIFIAYAIVSFIMYILSEIVYWIRIRRRNPDIAHLIILASFWIIIAIPLYTVFYSFGLLFITIVVFASVAATVLVVMSLYSRFFGS